MKLFSVCTHCDLKNDYDGSRPWGDFDRCPECNEVMEVWTASGVRNEEYRFGKPFRVVGESGAASSRESAA